MFTNSRLAKSVKLACAFGALSASMTATSVVAQEDEQVADEAVEKISVTGSRIKRASLESNSPVVSIDASVIESTGFSRIEDVMNTLPQIEAAQTAFQANGASGVANLDLRGLGPNRTLVLVNGRRLQPGGVYSQASDVNQIPAALVKRVDVLTGGASTTYGADAVAGVVNFIMDTDFTGFEITATAGGYQHDNDNDFIQGLMDDRGFEYPEGSNGIGGESYDISVTAGGDFAGDKGHATVYGTWRRNNEMLQGERDYSSCALNAAGTSCGGSSTAVLPNSFFYPIVDGAPDYGNELFWSLNEDGSFSPYDGTNLYNYAPINHFMRPNERFTIGAFVDYYINDDTRVYMETNFMNDRTAGQIAESGTFYGAEYLFDYNNPILSDAQKAQIQAAFGQTDADQFVAYIGKRNVEGGPRADNLEHNSFRMVTGVEGVINDMWSYDVSYMYSQTSSSSAYINDLFLPSISPRVGEVGTECTDDCLLYQVYTPYGVTPEMAGQLSGTAVLTGNTSLIIYNGFVTGEFDFSLPGADTPVAAVFGLERRETDFERVSDTVYQEGSLVGQGGPTESLVGSFDVNEVFTEISLPVIEDAPGVENLTVDLALRISDYTTSGNATTYKVAADWAITEDYKFRASFNRAIRAPNINELFAGQSIGLWGGVDGCANGSGEDGGVLYSEAQCAATGVTAAQYGSITANPANQYNQFSGGNPNLDPEEADTFTFGFVASPFEDFDFAIDYWKIDMEEVIGTVGAQTILQLCATRGEFCDNVNRSAAGSLWISQDAFITNLSDNVGGRKWAGVDLDMAYSMDLAGGTLRTNIVGSYNLDKTYQPLLSDPSLDYDCSGIVSVQCFAQPKWRHTMTANYSMDDWTAIARWRYYGDVDFEGEGGLSSYSFFDLTGSYQINDYLAVSAGVNNVLDKEPPMVGGSLSTNANTVAGFYDTLGRYLFTTVTLSF
ncbi:TonB-dependent receptor [Alteromonas sp. KC3]|uniref:TonB-dependent receptor domain-containing protein n=1 Tax=unclassified Alteromonas TaxID=2614992 RepID=UPI001922DA68|nr:MULTISPECIES: TonB-dependent receptor [unclassified Alteromonas]BCO18231.1 TonB-dependent receptor [Alteromonas sp. KC3]BCO22191.1 TonB-dependent receptor [Alteromonas sp. KC14]